MLIFDKIKPMKRFILLLLMSFTLSSCVVSTATKVVKTTTKVATKAVKGTVKGVSWAVKKAEGKIDENRLNGDWKLVGVYKGSYVDILKNDESEDLYENACVSGDEIISFKSKKEKWQTIHCASDKVSWEKYKFEFGKNPTTKDRENYLTFDKKTHVSIIDVNHKHLILEGDLLPTYALKGGKVYLFEKK